MQINKALFTYVGINREKPERKDKRFSVEVTTEELNRIKTFPFPATFTGKVVRRGDKFKDWEIGYTSPNFCNPFYDFYRFHHAGWIVQTCICEGNFHNEHCVFRVS